MGAEESRPISPSTPPTTLKSRTLPSLAAHILSPACKNIVVMTGAGISTSAGIPDFRSPATGLYANLARLQLPYPEAVFDISFFRRNPLPFYTLAHELYPGRYRPTLAHSFIRLLHDKGKLSCHFTQNIDCLDREAGVPAAKIVEAHGSFARQSCIECRRPFPADEMRRHVHDKSVPRCEDASCGGLVKPEIVFFGEALPGEFFEKRGLPAEADLVVVMGTSLTVQPFASLPALAGEGTPRVLVNLEGVGGLGSRADDVLVLGECDEGVRKIAEACGWLEELERLWEGTGGRVATEMMEDEEGKRDKDEKVQDEVEKLTRDVERTLKLSGEHKERVRGDVGLRRELEGHLQGKYGLDGERGQESTGLAHVFPHIKKDSSL